MTVTGTNTFKKGLGHAAIINSGGGLNIQGTGSLTLDKTTTNYGAGIGSDSGEKFTGDIIISRVTINAVSNSGAAIGSGGLRFGLSGGGSVGNIIIEDATLNLQSDTGALIGSGEVASAGNIAIINSAITGETDTGAGVGSGSESSITSATVDDISIYNSTLNITTGGSACIGSGYKSSGVNDILVSNSVVTGKSIRSCFHIEKVIK